jgi:hypothetical protein
MPAVADIGHAVQFYRDDAELCDTVGTYLAEGIRDGAVSIVVATDPFGSTERWFRFCGTPAM